MKNKLFIPLIFLSTLTMTSCGGDYSGSYTFQMGKDKGTHVIASMELSKKDFSYDNKLLGKEFKFTADIQDSDGSTTYNDMIKIAYDLLGDGTSVNGYYYVDTKKDINNEQIIHLGFIIDENDLKELSEITQFDASDLNITAEMAEYIFYSTMSNTSLNIHIPVSMDDLLLQFYWYGYDFYIEELTLKIDMVEAHEKGTHPTEKDIEEINNSAQYQAKHPENSLNSRKFRDYHCISLSLLKN